MSKLKDLNLKKKDTEAVVEAEESVQIDLNESSDTAEIAPEKKAAKKTMGVWMIVILCILGLYLVVVFFVPEVALVAGRPLQLLGQPIHKMGNLSSEVLPLRSYQTGAVAIFFLVTGYLVGVVRR